MKNKSIAESHSNKESQNTKVPWLSIILIGVIVQLIMTLVSVSKDEKNIDLNSVMTVVMDHVVGNLAYIEGANISDSLLEERIIVLASRINEYSSQKIIQQLIYLEHQQPGEPIDLYIRTTGGWIDDAFSIIDTFSEISSPVNVHAMGNCSSSGFLILIAATGKSTCGENSKIGIHMNQFEGKEYSTRTVNYFRFSRLLKRISGIPHDWIKKGKK